MGGGQSGVTPGDISACVLLLARVATTKLLEHLSRARPGEGGPGQLGEEGVLLVIPHSPRPKVSSADEQDLLLSLAGGRGVTKRMLCALTVPWFLLVCLLCLYFLSLALWSLMGPGSL